MNCKIYYDGSQIFNSKDIQLVEKYAININTFDHHITVTRNDLGLSIRIFKYLTFINSEILI